MTDIANEPPRAHARIVYLGPVSPHWEVYGDYGERTIGDEFRARVLARLVLLPRDDPQFRRNRERIVRDAERRVVEIDAKLCELRGERVDEADVAAAFADFENVWTALSPREQVRLVNLLVHRVEFDAADSSIEVSFYPSGIKSLANGADDPAPTETKPPVERVGKRPRAVKEVAA